MTTAAAAVEPFSHEGRRHGLSPADRGANRPSSYFRSKRSRFITFVQAATKSLTNFSFASAPA